MPTGGVGSHCDIRPCCLLLASTLFAFWRSAHSRVHAQRHAPLCKCDRSSSIWLARPAAFVFIVLQEYVVAWRGVVCGWVVVVVLMMMMITTIFNLNVTTLHTPLRQYMRVTNCTHTPATIYARHNIVHTPLQQYMRVTTLYTHPATIYARHNIVHTPLQHICASQHCTHTPATIYARHNIVHTPLQQYMRVHNSYTHTPATIYARQQHCTHTPATIYARQQTL